MMASKKNIMALALLLVQTGNANAFSFSFANLLCKLPRCDFPLFDDVFERLT